MLAIKKVVIASSCALVATGAQAGFLDNIIDTLPGAISPYADAGAVGNQLNGMHYLIKDGTTSLLLPTYTDHMWFDYDQRETYNAMPFGGGIARGIVDERGNERLMYLMFFRDSHYEIEPIMGYAWVARFPIANTGLHVGAGYTAGFTFREDYSWLPIPVPLPLVSVGTEMFNLYATYIPFTNVLFVFSRFEMDERIRRTNPILETSPWSLNTEIYAQGSWSKTDLSGSDHDVPDTTLSSDSGYKFGIRYFIDRHWAWDLSHERSEHDLKEHGAVINSFRFSATNLMLQYHYEVADTVRLHLGAGATHSKLKGLESKYNESDWAPVVQTGFTWAMSKHLRLTGDMTVNYAYFRDVKKNAQGDVIPGRFKPAHTSFNVGLGFAF